MTLPPELQLRYDEGNKALLWYGRMTDADRDAALALTRDEAVRGLIRTFYEQSQPRPMTAEFVFAGSGFYTSTIPAEGEGGEARTVTRYAAEGGEVVCVANFQSATIDVNARSSAEGQGVLYEAATEAIPEGGHAGPHHLHAAGEGGGRRRGAGAESGAGGVGRRRVTAPVGPGGAVGNGTGAGVLDAIDAPADPTFTPARPAVAPRRARRCSAPSPFSAPSDC